MNNIDKARAEIFADADVALFIAGICFDVGLEDLAIDIDRKVRDALAPFRRGSWIGNNGGRRAR